MHQRNSKKYFFARGDPGGGAKFPFSLLETGRSNLNTKISINIKEIQKDIFWPGASKGGEGAKFLFSLY